jgi:hypothetical protein
LLCGCFGGPDAPVYNAATVVYTEGASRDTVVVELPIPPRDVFFSMSRIIDQLTDIEVVSRDGKSLTIEILSKDKRLTGQATELGNGDTLLFLWADAGASGQSGEELALSAVKRICEDLNVTYKLVTP